VSDERLQKVLARAGLASRRAAEEFIRDGRVRVDGRIVRELGTRVGPRARVEVDGVRVIAERLIYVILHKPRGVVSTLSDPEGRPTVAELLKGIGARVVPVGRLDYHTSGALLCTNDGEFAERLLHPKGKVPKEYVAKVRGIVDDAALERWRESIVIDGRATQPAEVRVLRFEGDKTWLSIVLHEGRNRQVRRLGETTGFLVMRLARLAHAGITTEGLRPGQYRHLTKDELVDLKQAYGVPRRVRPPEPLPVQGRVGAPRVRKAPRERRPSKTRREGRPTREREGRPTREREGRPTREREGRPTRERAAQRGGSRESIDNRGSAQGAREGGARPRRPEGQRPRKRR
jgi:23S rRNA pseudouridine2605 synthase